MRAEMNRTLFAATFVTAFVSTLAILVPALPLAAAEIPKSPDQLTFKPFTYTPPSAKDYRAALKAGPVIYIAEDNELPLVNIAITLRLGTYLNPPGKEGLAEMAGYLLTKAGTKKRKAEDLDEDIEFLAANVNSTIDADRGSVSLNLLGKDVDKGLQILREILTEPAFQENKIQLRKDQMTNDMKARNDDSTDIENRERGFLATGEGFYTNRYTTKASVESITQKDLLDFHKKWFDPKNMTVAVAGQFKKADMLKKLEAFFANWPIKGEASPGVPKPTHKMVPGLFLVDKDVNQGRVSVLLPGIQRNDADLFPSQIMNDILGGGFTSRITNRVRSDEGLAYSAGSRLVPGIWYPGTFTAGFQSKARTCSYATQIVLDEMKKMTTSDVKDDELDTAKKQFVETLPRRFATKAQTVGVLLDEEFTGRYKTDPGYYANYKSNVEKVGKADVSRVAKRLLTPESATILVVGKKADLLNPDPKHPVKYADLTGGKLTELPLRDPFTMKPIPLGASSAPVAPAPQAAPAPKATPPPAPK